MFSLQNCKFVNHISPQSTNGTAVNGSGVDTSAYSEIAFVVSLGAVGANMDGIKVQYSADNSSWSDVTGGTFTAPTTAAANTVSSFFTTVPSSRYYRVNFDPGAAATLTSVVCILGRPRVMPSSITDRGVGEALIV